MNNHWCGCCCLRYAATARSGIGALSGNAVLHPTDGSRAREAMNIMLAQAIAEFLDVAVEKTEIW